jgi:intracellular multiplication protein IcmB
MALKNNRLLSLVEWIDDFVNGSTAHLICQWRAAVVPGTRLGKAAHISELLSDSHVRTEDELKAESGNKDVSAFPEPYSLEMADGTLVSFMLVRGTRTNMRELDVAKKAEKLATKMAAYMNTGGGKAHSFGVYFLHDPHTADQVFKQKIAPLMATARRFGGDADMFMNDLKSRLVHGAAEEMTLFTVRTHQKSLRADQIKPAQEQYQKMIVKIMASGRGVKNTPMALQAPYGQAVLARSAVILQRHEGLVSTLLNDFNGREVGISVMLLGVREAFERVRRFGDRELPYTPSWKARVFGQDGSVLAPSPDNVVPTPLSLGMQVLTRKVVGHIDRNVEISSVGSTWYGTAVMEVGPISPRKNPSQTVFSALMRTIKSNNLPLCMSFEILPRGLDYNRLNQFFNSFLGNIGASNRQIRNAFKEMRDYQEANGTVDPIVGLRIAVTTWNRNREKAEQALLELGLAMNGWGSIEASSETGAPDVARLAAIPEFMSGSPAPIVPAPLQDVMYMSPLMRPASEWEEGQLLFKTNDGVIYPVAIGSSKHQAYVQGIAAPSGSGKSFLMNRIHACLGFSPGAQKIPYITNIDVAPSGKGFQRIMRTILPKSMHHLIVYYKVLNERAYCVNPFDLQLGCERPTGPGRDFLISVLETAFDGLGEETPQFIDALIDMSYATFDANATTARLWQPSDSPEIAKELDAIGFHIPEGKDVTVYTVRDALFRAGRIEAARVAQRFAVPRMEDLTRIMNGDQMKMAYGTARFGGEDFLDKAARMIENATRQFPVLASVTRKDLDNARVIVIDLQNVLGGSSKAGKQFAGMMYLYARHLGAGNFFLDVDEIRAVCTPEYLDYQVARVREIQQTPKILTYDEWHNVRSVPGLVALNEKETRETRKYRVYLNFVTQYVTDFPDAILDGLTSLFVVGQQSMSQNKHTAEKLGLSDTDLSILQDDLTTVGRLWAWFKLRSGPVTAVLNNSVGPLETWCYTTDDKDSPLRDELERLIGETEAVTLLAKQFPSGSAADVLDRRSRAMGDRSGTQTETVTSILAAELAAKFYERNEEAVPA